MNNDYTTLETKHVDENGHEVWRGVGEIISRSESELLLTKDLSLRIKNILSPYARTKSDRRANYLYRHSHDKIDLNLIIMLHGAGDSHFRYHDLAKTMNLPQTASLCIHASAFGEGFVKIPLSLGYTWFQQMDYNTGDVLKSCNERLILSLKNAVDRINQLIDELNKDGWLAERIFLFGYSAGACLAMHVCDYRQQNNLASLGGAICIAGGLICNAQEDKIHEKVNTDIYAANSTEVLVLCGSHDEVFSCHTANESVQRYNLNAVGPAAVLKIRRDKKHEMISGDSDMREVMGFLGRKLVRRTIKMEGYCEIK